MTGSKPLIGVLALQGGFEAHERMLRVLDVQVREVRTVADLEGVDGLVIPGGESTTMTLGIEREGLAEPLRELVRPELSGAGDGWATGEGRVTREGRATGEGVEGQRAEGGVPVLGSCAGMIMLDREHLGLMDMRVERNAFGRQLQSFETDLRLDGRDWDPGGEGPVRAVFIRAPWIVEHGPDVEVLAEVEGHPVAARQNRALAVAFHAELTDDDRIHRMFLDMVAAAGSDRREPRYPVG